MSPHLHIEMMRANNAELTRNAEHSRRTSISTDSRSRHESPRRGRFNLGFARLRLARS